MAGLQEIQELSDLPQPAEVAGRFLVSEEAGRDPFGIVYIARDISHGDALKSLSVTVALRILSPELRAEVRAAILSEARAAQPFSHPNLVRLFDILDAGDASGFTFEALRGVDLERRLNTKRLKPFQAIRALRDIAGALSYLEGQGVSMLSISPRAILFQPNFRIKLLPLPSMHREMEGHGAMEGAVQNITPVAAFGSLAHLLLYGTAPGGKKKRGILSLLGRDPHPRELKALVDRCLEPKAPVTLAEVARDIDALECSFPAEFEAVDSVVQKLLAPKPNEFKGESWNGTLFVFLLALYLSGVLALLERFSATLSIFFR